MEDDTVSCKLKVCKDLTGKTPVFLVNFPNGYVNSNKTEKLNFKCYQQNTDESIAPSHTKRVLYARNHRLGFESTSRKSDYCRSTYQYFVGVRKKNSSKMKIYESASFHLKPIRISCDAPLTSEDKKYRDKLDDLTTSFGSKVQKRTMAARQKYSTDAIQLEGTLEDLSLDNSYNKSDHSTPVNTTSSTNIDYIPPQNHDARFVNDVYNIKEIIPVEINEYLTERAEEILQDIPTHLSRWKTDSTYCDYVLKHLEVDIDCTRVKYLLFYNFLFKFSSLLSSDVKKKDPAPEIPEPVKSYLLETFTVSSTSEYGKTVKTFPLKMKDKLLAYMIVVALFIDEFFVNLALLQNGLKYGLPKVSNVAKALGCYIYRRKIDNASIPFAQLKLPLNTLTKYSKKF